MKKDFIIFRLTPDESQILLTSLYAREESLKRHGVDVNYPLYYRQYSKLAEKLADVIGNNKFRVLLATL